MIPEGWKLTTVGEHIDLLGGFAFKSSLYSESEGSIKLLRGDNIEPGALRWRGVKKWDSEACKGLERYLLKEGDFVVSMDRTWISSGLKVAEVKKEDLPCLLVQRVSRVRSKSTLEQGLLRQLFSGKRFERYVKSVQTETAVPHISSSQIKEFPILLPPLSEQKVIAQILSTWDEAVTASERLIEASQQQRHALMQQLLTGKRRLPGFAVHAGWRHEKYGDVPNDWGFVEIGSFSRQSSEKNRETEELPVLSCSKYDGFVDSLSYFNKRVYSEDLSGYKVIRRGDIGFPSNHVEEGSIGLQNLYDRGLVSPIYVVFRPDEERVDPEFLFRLLKTDHYRQVFAASTNASVDRRGSLRWKEFSAIKVPLPSLDEQKAIVLALKTADAEIQAQQQRLDCLRQEKKALMQQLLTGKRRVKVEATALTEEAAC